MRDRTEEDRRLQQFQDICMALPETTCKRMNGHASFSVRKKTFAYYLNDHHGDGIAAVCCKVLPGDNAALVRSDPARFYLPAYIGAKGWVGLRVDLGEIDWDEVRELAVHSYLRTAPKTLCKQVELTYSRDE